MRDPIATRSRLGKKSSGHPEDPRVFLSPVLMLFLIFDIEVVFLYPSANLFRRLGLFDLVEMGIFLFILIIGFIYVRKKGALEWE
ncbi:MAG: NADH-quinone oxidoreductase subunit A [Deltaproteobacteria bacterium]|jgi:NADH:ubiquinone oxidoreductase subunit 3 (subunit A)|nr:NADH-quinone oxidoreductase subunit A [Deltaproteobacteria bacterium]MBI2531484.1 NADH-quinone oxidoreductase subunit A [Deltaproteobacteria bacterium]